MNPTARPRANVRGKAPRSAATYCADARHAKSDVRYHVTPIGDHAWAGYHVA